MITLNVTVYETEAGTKFKVYAHQGGVVVEVTDQYEVVAAQSEDGRDGFFVVKR